MNLVNQRRQALRANIICFSLKSKMQQWNDFICAFAVQADFFVFFVHDFSNLKLICHCEEGVFSDEAISNLGGIASGKTRSALATLALHASAGVT
jgi:hypothetical protein